MIRGLEHLSYEERLRDLGCSAWRRESSRKTILQPFSTQQDPHRTRDDSFKLREGRFRSDVRKKFFPMRVAKHWHRLPREVAEAPSLEKIKVRLDRALSNLV